MFRCDVDNLNIKISMLSSQGEQPDNGSWDTPAWS